MTNELKGYNIYTVIGGGESDPRRFTFDPDKSRVNAQKHGIDFVEAQRIWDDPDCVEVMARTVEEPRFLVIGRLDGRCWSAVFTYRPGGIRLISVRRSRPGEVAIYEGF